MPWDKDTITRLIEVEAQLQGVDPRLAVAVAQQESSLRPDNPGDNGKSRGVFHLQERAAIDAGIDPKQRDDPAIGIFGGVRYLKQQLDKSKGNIPQALSWYNRGTPDYRGIGDPDYVYHVMRHYPDHPLGKAPADQEAYRARLNKTFGAGTTGPADKPGLLARAANALSPARAEAASPPAAGRSRLEEIEAELARREGQPAQAPSPPIATSTPEQDAAYRASRGQQEPPTANTTTPTPPTQPGASQGPLAPSPDPSPTPGMRFQALPSIMQLEPADRMQKTKLFESLKPEAQEEFLRSEEPAAGGLAMGRGTVQQAQPVTDPAARLAVGGATRPVIHQPTRPPETPLTPEELDTALTRELAPAQKNAPLVLGGGAAGSLGRMAGTWGAQQLGRLGTALPVIGEGLANLGFRKGTVAAGMEEPGTAGDVVAVAAPAVAGAVAPVVAKVGNALRGVVKPAYQSIVDTAKQYGIRLSYGDVTKGSVAPKVEAVLEAIPGSGAGRMRVGQQADVTKAGETIQAGVKAEMQATPWRDLGSVQQAARGTGPRAKEAQILLSEISEAGDDWGRVIHTSGKLNLFQDRVRAEKLYDRVETLAQPLGNMRLPKTTQAIDDAIARANDDVLPSPEVKREVIGALNRLKGEVSPTESVSPSMGVRDPATGTLRAEPVTTTTSIPDTTYSRMRRLRSSLGDLQREAAEPATARYLSGVKTALEEDLDTFARQSGVPQLSRAAKHADTFYRTRIVPYREGQLAKAIEKNLPDEIYNQFVRRGKDRATYFYKGLDAKGQAAVRYGMIEEAIEKATSGKPDVFSPARFATSLKKIQDAHGVFFKGTPQWEMHGITKLMQHAERAGQYMENPPTGLRAGIGTGMVSVGSLANVPLAVGALLQAQGLRTMLMTQRGRNFLLAASDMQPGSSAFQKQLDAFLRTLPAAVAGTGAAARAPEETAAR